MNIFRPSITDLELHTKDNNSFSKQTPGMQLVWDSTSLGVLKECPRKYLLQNILSIKPIHASHHLTFGILFHRASEIYHKSRASGADYHTAVRETVRDALINSASFQQIIECSSCFAVQDALPPSGLCPICGGVDFKSYSRVKSILPEDEAKNRLSLIRSIVWYFDTYQNTDYPTYIRADGKPAVELHFRFPVMATTSGEMIEFTGHLDRLIQAPDGLYIDDFKTSGTQLTEMFFSKFRPDNQMSFYTFAGQVMLSTPIKGILIDGIQVLKGGVAFARSLIHRTTEEIQTFLDDALYWIGFAHDCAASCHFPANDKSCHNYGKCPYRDLCIATETQRELLLKSDFKREPWDPTIER